LVLRFRTWVINTESVSNKSKRVRMDPLTFVDLVIKVVNEAEQEGIVLRTMGAVATYIRVKDNADCLKLYETLGRVREGEIYFTDLDLVSYKKLSKNIEKFFRSKGFEPDYYINAFFSDRRMIFYHPHGLFSMDVFFSPLEFSHKIDLGSDPKSGRLNLEKITLAPADLLLLKLQIHEITRKDVADATILLSCHDLSNSDEPGKINVQRLVEVLSRDWGFYYDAMNNLNTIKTFMQSYSTKLENKYIEILRRGMNNVDEIIRAVESAPKSKEWIKRSKIGTKERWYNIVEDI